MLQSIHDTYHVAGDRRHVLGIMAARGGDVCNHMPHRASVVIEGM